MNTVELAAQCKQLRRDIVNMLAESGSGHPGGSLSAVELMAAVYYTQMHINPQDPKDPSRDRFVLSKGHAAPCLYAILAEMGFFDRAELNKLRKLGAMLQGHPVVSIPGVEASTGSLGQGVSMAVGMALGFKAQHQSNRVYTILGDGELQEGQVWEAAMAAAHYQLDNLTVIIDNNGLQIDGANSQVMALGDIGAKFRAFGFEVLELADGHDLEAIIKALETPVTGRPKCILAHTVKGKGVSYMENQVDWHGKAPNEEQRQQAMKELEG